MLLLLTSVCATGGGAGHGGSGGSGVDDIMQKTVQIEHQLFFNYDRNIRPNVAASTSTYHSTVMNTSFDMQQHCSTGVPPEEVEIAMRIERFHSLGNARRAVLGERIPRLAVGRQETRL